MNLPARVHSALRIVLGTLFGILVSSTASSSQTPANFGHQAWTTENGLPQNSVHQIFQSGDGYIWIATEGGAARFNGTDFKVFNHESNPAFTSDDISCFAQDTQNALWIGTSDGLLRYSSGDLRRFTAADGLPSSEIASIVAGKDGSLYILTGGGAVKFDGKSFSPLQLAPPTPPSAIASAGDGNIVIASSSGIVHYENGRALSIPVSASASKQPIQSIGALPHQGLWLRTRSSITLMQSGHQRILQAERDLHTTRIESFLAGSRGDLWIGTNRGLFSLDSIDGPPKIQEALGSNTILSLFKDKEDNLWIGTETAGVHILRQQKFRTLPAFSDHVITAVTQATDGSIWAGTNSDGLGRWQSGNVQHFSTRNGLLSESILALAPGDHGGVWVGTPDGLNHVHGAKILTYTSADGLPDDFIRSLLSDQDGSLWIGTRRGLAHLHDKTVTTFTQANGLGSDLVGALVKSQSPDSRGDLWIGTLDGLSRLRNGAITTYSTKDGLSGNVITSLFEDSQNTLWIGTKGNGLSFYANGKFTALHHPNLPVTVDSILEDGRGFLWLGSTRGVRQIARSELIACSSSPHCELHPHIYGYADGMPTDEVSSIGHPTAWRTTDGRLWFATRKGIAIADPEHLSENSIPPPVAIERFTVDESDLRPSPNELSIPPGRSRFVFEYAGLSFAAPSKVRYRYILEGFDKQWTQAGARRIAYYTNLPAKHYHFRVQAANNDGVWNETGATVVFFVRPPFYRRVWFILLSLLLITALAVLLYRLRVRRLSSQFDAVLAERNRMAREIHDTLAQSFVGVSVQLELATQLLNQSQTAAAQDQLNRTRAYVREGLAEARRSIWDLRAITAQHTLPTRLTHLVESSSLAPLTTHLNIGGTYRPLAPAVEDEVLRIAQEALTNVSRHAHANHISVDLRYHSDRLVLTLSDDGRGFRTSDDSLPANGHFGLQGMRERAAQINAQLTIESSEGKGTRITLDAPILAARGTTNA